MAAKYGLSFENVFDTQIYLPSVFEFEKWGFQEF